MKSSLFRIYCIIFLDADVHEKWLYASVHDGEKDVAAQEKRVTKY